MCVPRPARTRSILIVVALLLASCGGGAEEELAGPATGSSSVPTLDPDGGDPDGGDTDRADEEAAGSGTTEATADTADPGDVDQDGVFDGDNCPGLFNPTQTDDDLDGIGNECDDVTDLAQGTCDFAGTLAQEAAASGDSAVVTICQPMIQGDLPGNLLAIGTPLLVTDDYLIIDLTPAQLDEARDLGLETEVSATIAGRSPADLIELRIERDPTTALTTADPTALADVKPADLGRVPAEVLAIQPDRTLAAIPEEFWETVPPSTIEVIGRQRLLAVNPRLRALDRLRVPDGQFQLPDSSPAGPTASGPAVTSTTTTSSTTSTPPKESTTTTGRSTTTAGDG